jgi:hypothetical protein
MFSLPCFNCSPSDLSGRFLAHRVVDKFVPTQLLPR